jgi:quinol monooxygenase YgiN
MISVLAKMPIKEDKVEEAIQAVKELMIEVAKEEGTLSYTLNRDQKNPNTLVFMERYKDRAAMEAHSATPHFKAFFGKSRDFLAGRPEIILMEELASI